MSDQSNNSNKDIKVLFQTMFSDSQVAKDFEMSPNKTGYVINYGLAPFFKEQLQDELKKSHVTSCHLMKV